MGPVIERIAQGVRDRAGPGQEFLVGIGVAGAVALVDAVGAHGAPLVVVALQPDLGEVAELPVLRDVRGGQVAVVVENRLVLGEGVIEMPGGLRLSAENLRDKGHDGLMRALVKIRNQQVDDAQRD